MADKKNLEQRSGRENWYAVVEVPRHLRPLVGRKRLRKSLGTPSLKEAQQRRGLALAELQLEIYRLAGNDNSTERAEWDSYRKLANELRQRFANGQYHSDDGVELMDGADIAMEEVEPRFGKDRAQEFRRIVEGKSTPLRDHIDDWLSQDAMTDRTRANYRSAIDEFLQHQGGDIAAEKVNRRLAGQYVTEYLVKQRGLQPASVNKKVSALSTFWQWLEKRGLAKHNPWEGQGLPKKQDHRGRSQDHQLEREFTDTEVKTLLDHAPDQTLREFLLIQLLSGMRREEPAQLRVKDVDSEAMQVREGKSTEAVRLVPIHPDLAPMIRRRTQGKSPDAYLFDELRENKNGRSDAIGKRFGRVRRRLNVTEEGAGRRERVNMHSCRRWFVTKAEQAGYGLDKIAPIVGHEYERANVTGGYSGGPTWDQLREIVASVKLPTDQQGGSS